MASQRGVSCGIQEDALFMNCIIQVNIRKKGWQKSVSGIIRSIQEVRSCRVGEDGIVQVSGFVIPDVLMKALDKVGKRAEVLWLQYGKCSTNLFGPDPQIFRGSVVPYYDIGRVEGSESINCCSLM